MDLPQANRRCDYGASQILQHNQDSHGYGHREDESRPRNLGTMKTNSPDQELHGSGHHEDQSV